MTPVMRGSVGQTVVMGHDEDNLLATVSAFGPDDETADVYDRWADTYDTDLIDRYGYNSPALVASTLAAMVDDLHAPIVDHACGTGLSGVALAHVGFTSIDGVDLSSGMLERAATTGAYRNLHQVDLTAPGYELASAPYAAMAIVGGIGPGHIEAEALPSLLRTVAPGAPVVVSYNAAYDESDDYGNRIDAIETDGH